MSSERDYTRLLEQIQALRRDIATGLYDLGLLLKRIRDHELWRAGGHPTFADFCKSAEVSVKKSLAYDLFRLTDAFDRDTFQKAGVSRLRIVVTAKGQERAQLLEAALGGVPVRELAKMAGRRGETPSVDLERLKALEKALRSAFNPHTPRCLGMLNHARCTCGVAALMKGKRRAR